MITDLAIGESVKGPEIIFQLDLHSGRVNSPSVPHCRNPYSHGALRVILFDLLMSIFTHVG